MIIDSTLSDAFLVPREGYEWTAHMLNMNGSGNQDLMNRCSALKGYVTLIQYVREYQKAEDSLLDAMDKAIDRCTKEGVLKEYLLKKKSEVKLMLLTEFDEEAFAETMREEGERRVNQLYSKLIEEKRNSDLERAIQDKKFRDVLYKRYGL